MFHPPGFIFRYLLTLREEFNVTSVVDSLVQKGVISADAGTEVFRQGNIRAQIEMCIHEVCYFSHFYNNVLRTSL